MTGNDSVKISVVIPFYNGREWLKEALISVLSQTYTSLEIIVVNDGSDEDISELTTLFSKEVNFIKVTNGGAASARNIGISMASGTYVAFLDSDDVWVSTKIEDQLHFMLKNGLVWSHTDYTRFIDGTTKEVYVSAAISGKIFPKCLVSNPIATPCVMIKRAVLISDNLLFEVGNKVGEDNILWEKLGEQYELGHLPSALTNVRMHSKNAAFMAHVQLKWRGEAVVRVQLKRHTFDRIFLYYYFLAVLFYCKYINQFFEYILKKFNTKPANFEFIFKLLYSFAYLHFRIIRKLI